MAAQNQEVKQRRVIKSFSIDHDLAARLDSFQNQSDVVKRALRTWLEYYSLEAGVLELKDQANYVFIAKTRWGKTTLVKNLLAKAEKPVLVIDPHGEYEHGKLFEQTYFERIPLIGEEMYRLVKSTMWSKIDAFLGQFFESRGGVLRLNFTDLEAEKIYVSELLRSLLQRHIQTKECRLLVVEEAQRYSEALIPIVSQGLKNGLQTVAISQFPLPSEIMLNSTPVLGYSWKDLLSTMPLPREILEAVQFLRAHEFIFYASDVEAWRILRADGCMSVGSQSHTV